nr:hypothetical protein [Streptomyces albus]
MLAFLAFGAIVTVRAVRAVKRGVERTGAQVRRTVEETTLKARTAQPGPVGEAARLRLELRSSIDGTRAALEAGARQDPGLSEALGLLDQLHEHARQLDGELRLLMEREPDRARISARLPEARERVRHIKESADSLRFAAQDRASRFDSEGLSALRDRIDVEAGALRHWDSGPMVAGPEADGAVSGGAGERPAGGTRPGERTSQAEQPADRSRPRELGPSAQGLNGLDPSLTDPAADRERTEPAPAFRKRPPRSAS